MSLWQRLESPAPTLRPADPADSRVPVRDHVAHCRSLAAYLLEYMYVAPDDAGMGCDGTGIVLVVGCTGSSDRCNTFGLWDDPSTKVGTDYRAIHPLQDSVHESYRSILHVALKL